MRKLQFLLIACLAVFVMASCSESEPVVELPQSKAVKFDAAIENFATRASGTTWGATDAIGVYMKTAGGNLATAAISGAENIQYTTPGSGKFTAATTGIELPEDGSNVDFIAYYPYQSTLTGYTYPINVSNQFDLAKLDLLYSNNAVNKNKANPVVDLNFKHKLSQLILNIVAGDGVNSLTGLSLSVSGLITEGAFNLSDASITLGSTKATFAPKVNIASSSATVNAILIPGDDMKSGTLTFTLGGVNYEWTPEAQVLESGKKYTYPLQLSATGKVILLPDGSIDDWTEGNPGGPGIVITPSEDDEDDVFRSNKTEVSLGATASLSADIQLTTQDDEDWTATSSETWLTLSSASGTGSKTITLAAEANSGTERTATVTLTPTTTTFPPVTITVTQAEGGGGTGEREEFFNENFGDGNDYSSTRPKIAAMKDWSMGAPITYTDLYEKVDIRSTKGGVSPSVWFPAASSCELVIGGIDQLIDEFGGFTGIKLSYELAANTLNNAKTAHIVVYYTTTVSDIYEILSDRTEVFIAPNEFVPITDIDLPDNVSKLKFYYDSSSSGPGYRLDNVVLTGIKK